MIPVLFHESLDFWRKDSPDKPALIFEDVELSYEEFCRWTDGVAAALHRRGVKPGDVVNVTAENSAEWIVAAVGIMKSGAIFSGLNQRCVAAEFSYMIERCGSRLVFADARRREVLSKVEPRGRLEILPLEDLGSYRGGEAWTPPKMSPEDPLVLVFTSGSTGRPKAVLHTHVSSLASAIERQMMEPVINRDMRHLVVLPLYGNAGSVSGCLNSLVRGATFVVERRFDAGRTLAQIERHRISAFNGVPLLYEQMAAHPDFEKTRLDSLKSVWVGGARVSPELLKVWRRRGVLIRQLYGMTELGIVVTVSTDEEVMSGAETCGRGSVFTRLRTARPDGSDCEPGEPGEIRVKGPGTTPGYWRDQENTANLFDADGWVKTGDIGTLDKNGYLKYVDRAKDIIISGGTNISPSEIENVILKLDGVVEVAVIAAKDPKFAETPMAIVYASKPIDPPDVVKLCNEQLSDYKVPRYVDIVDAPLPRLAGGKIDKPTIRMKYTDAHLRLPKLR